MTKRIAIVGAGCAGLGAATYLLQSGKDLEIGLIEAANWIGGRATTSASSPGLPVDLGPQFVQDPEINPWTHIMKAMAKEMGYQEKDFTPIVMDSLYRIRQPDDTWTTAELNNDISAMSDRLQEQYDVASGFKNAPIMTGNAPAFVKGQQYVRLSMGSNELGAIAESAEPWQYLVSDQARQVVVKSKVPGNIYVPNGLGNLVQRYGEDLMKLKGINLIDEAVVTSIQDDGKKVTLRSKDDRSSDYDYCIVTVAPNQLGKIDFQPALPGPMQRAIDYVRLGSYKKVAFRPTKFPREEEQGDDSIKQLFEYYVYDRDNDCVWQYFRLPTDPTILICVTAGDSARRLDNLEDNKLPPIVIGLLKDAYAETDANFKPVRDQTVVTNWTNWQYVEGAYSYTRPDPLLDRDNPIPFEARLRLAEPHGRIHFAGEATWPDAYGTIHGAYFSGERAAKEILRKLGG